MNESTEESRISAALEDFAGPPFGNVHWPVYETYEIQVEDGEEVVVAPAHLDASRTEEWRDSNGRRVGRRIYPDAREGILTRYAPLQAPELLVDLAALLGKPITAEVFRGWAETYGLLGLSEHDVVNDGLWNVKGFARRDRLQDFAAAVEKVGSALWAYKLATSDSPPANNEEGTYVGGMPKKAMPIWKMRFNGDRQWQLEMVAKTVQMGLAEHCHPLLTVHTNNRLPSGRFSLGYGFKSLLGAVWLQMARLLEDGGESTKFCRLPECPRLVNFKPGEPVPDEIALEKHNARGKQKTPKHKVFCSHNCTSKYSYRKKHGWAGYR